MGGAKLITAAVILIIEADCMHSLCSNIQSSTSMVGNNNNNNNSTNYLTLTSSTSNNSFEFGGISGGAPAEPYLWGEKNDILTKTSPFTRSS